MSNNRIYNRKEISRIMTKASEIQARKELHENGEGLSESEIVAVAEEVGIDKDAILEALHALDTPESNSAFNWISGTSSIQEMALIDGEMDERKWEELVQIIQQAASGVGKLGRVGSTYEWEQKLNEIGHRHFSFTPQKDGKTRIRFTSGWFSLKVMTMILSFIGGAILTGIFGSFLAGSSVSDEFAPLIILCGGLLAQPIGRYVLKTYFNKQKRIFKEVVESFGKLIAKSRNPGITIDDDIQTEQEQSSSTATRIRS